MRQITGYHFTGDLLRNGEPIPKIGKWLIHKGEVEPCVSGLHASEQPFDALQYATGVQLHKVVLIGNPLKSHGNNGTIDKWAGNKRKILDSLDSKMLLRDFARWCALQVIHLWSAPKIVSQYLETGDESMEAWAAARNSAMTAAWARAEARDSASEWDAAWAAYGTEFNNRIETAFK